MTISFLIFFTLLPTNYPHTHTYSLVLTGLDFLFGKLYYMYFFSVLLPSLNSIPLRFFSNIYLFIHLAALGLTCDSQA